MRSFVVPFVLSFAACSHQPHTRLAIDTPDEPLVKATIVATAPAAAGNVLRRDDVMRVLDKTPGYFLQKVSYEAALENGRFIGWRLESGFGPLQKGDVVQTVNGHVLERPEQLFDTWRELKSSRELVIVTRRGLQSRTFHWQIVDDAESGAR